MSGVAPQVGGIPAVMKYLLQKGFLDGSCLTVTGAPCPACLGERWSLQQACHGTDGQAFKALTLRMAAGCMQGRRSRRTWRACQT